MADFGTTKSKRRGANWLLWRRISPMELQDQVRKYTTLKIYQSARGLSLIFFLGTGLITALTTEFINHNRAAYLDSGLLIGLGVFIYFGHRWAMIFGMALWTIKKVFQLIGVIQGGHFANPFGIYVFWSLFMHAMYLAYRVEQTRRSAVAVDTSVFD